MRTPFYPSTPKTDVISVLFILLLHHPLYWIIHNIPLSIDRHHTVRTILELTR